MRFTEFEELDKFFERMMGRFPSGSPVYYGYKMTLGPDGRPFVREYGNAGSCASCDTEREIQVDTIVDEKKSKVKMVAEIPGVEKKDIELSLNGQNVLIGATRGGTKYHAQVPVKQQINTDTIKATYRNGILEIVFDLESKPKGRVVRVE